MITNHETANGRHPQGRRDGAPMLHVDRPIMTNNTHSAKKKNTARGPSKRSSVSWSLINFWLDGAMLVVFVALVAVAAVIRFVFPAATTAAGWQLWGLSLDGWSDVQFVLLVTLTLGIVVHLMLHWSWICGVLFAQVIGRKKTELPDDGTRTIYGVGLLIALLHLIGIFVALAAFSVKSPL